MHVPPVLIELTSPYYLALKVRSILSRVQSDSIFSVKVRKSRQMSFS